MITYRAPVQLLLQIQRYNGTTDTSFEMKAQYFTGLPLSMCVCICVYTNVFVFMYVCVFVHMCVCICVYTNVFVCVFAHSAFVYTQMCLFVCMFVCLYTYVCVCIVQRKADQKGRLGQSATIGNQQIVFTLTIAVSLNSEHECQGKTGTRWRGNMIFRA